MANDLRHPENVDLSWIEKPDPPLSSVITVKKTSWYIYFGLLILVIGLLILVLFLK